MEVVDFIVYFMMFMAVIQFYLKRTGKTFKEMVDNIIEFFRGLMNRE